MKIVWSPNAKARIREILDYIAEDDPKTALSFIEQIDRKVNDLAKNPDAGRLVPVTAPSVIRELVVHKNYGVVYERTENSIEILTVRHFRQEYPL